MNKVVLDIDKEEFGADSIILLVLLKLMTLKNDNQLNTPGAETELVKFYPELIPEKIFKTMTALQCAIYSVMCDYLAQADQLASLAIDMDKEEEFDEMTATGMFADFMYTISRALLARTLLEDSLKAFVSEEVIRARLTKWPAPK